MDIRKLRIKIEQVFVLCAVTDYCRRKCLFDLLAANEFLCGITVFVNNVLIDRLCVVYLPGGLPDAGGCDPLCGVHCGHQRY